MAAQWTIAPPVLGFNMNDLNAVQVTVENRGQGQISCTFDNQNGRFAIVSPTDDIQPGQSQIFNVSMTNSTFVNGVAPTFLAVTIELNDEDASAEEVQIPIEYDFQ